jgi:hypothetical protein
MSAKPVAASKPVTRLTVEKKRQPKPRRRQDGFEEKADMTDPAFQPPVVYLDDRKELSRRRAAAGLTDVSKPAVMPLGCPIRRASAMLLNNVVSYGDEKSPPVFDPKVLETIHGIGMFPPGKVYKFDMFANTSIGTAAVGIILQSLSISPAVVSYAEWATLSALFDECKLVRAQLEFIPLIGSDGQNLSSTTATNLQQSTFICGLNYTNISTAPASFAAVGRLAHSSQVIRTIADSNGQSVFTMHAARSLPYARVAVPAVSDPPAGMLGSFDVATDVNTLTPTTTYYRNILRTTVALRMRA